MPLSAKWGSWRAEGSEGGVRRRPGGQSLHLGEPRNLSTYVTPEHFAKIHSACDTATLPDRQPFPAADWWRGLIVMAYMTGWRISELIALRRDDLDLDAGTAITRARDNKGRRDDSVKLHDVVVTHLRKLPSFDPCVLP